MNASTQSTDNDTAAGTAELAKLHSVKARANDEVINDDERERFFWKSRYPPEAAKRIWFDAAYVATVFFISVAGILMTWRGDLFAILGCGQCSSATLSRYAYVFFSGVLGGSLFGLKYLYKVVARGWWNVDRTLWRLFSPWLAGGIAFGVGTLASAGLFGFTVSQAPSGASFVSLGFIAGYFADSASRKMQEIADTLFGTHGNPRKGEAKKATGESGHGQQQSGE